MTPSMHLSALIVSFSHNPEAAEIGEALRRAFDLGHEFGRDRAADVVDQCNREGPYNAIGAASRIRALKVISPKPAPVVEASFLSDTPDA